MADDVDEFLKNYKDKPVARASPSIQDVNDFLAPFKQGLPATKGPGLAEGPGGEATKPGNKTTQGLINAGQEVLDTGSYIGRKLLSGLTQAGATQALYDENRLMPGFSPDKVNNTLHEFMTNPNASEKALGVGEPPNSIARVGGSIAQAAGAAPGMALAQPGSTALGAVGGEYLGLPGAFLGGISGGKIQSAIGRLINPPVKELESLAQQLGRSKSLQDAGKNLVDGADSHVLGAATAEGQNIKSLEKAIWQEVDPIAAGTPVRLNNTNQALLDLDKSSKFPSTAEALKVINPGPFAKIREQLASLLPELPGPTTLAPRPDRAISWEEARNLRTGIGEGFFNKRSALFDNADHKKLYAGISEDLRDAARAAGVEDAFDLANKTSSALRSHAEQFLQPILKENLSPEKIASWALGEAKKGGTRLSALREVMPEAVDDLTAAVLRQQPKEFLRYNNLAQEALIPDQTLREQTVNMLTRMFPKEASDAAKFKTVVVGGEFGAVSALGIHEALTAVAGIPGLSGLTTGAAGRVAGTLLGPRIVRGIAAGVSGVPNALMPGLIGIEAGGRGSGRQE